MIKTFTIIFICLTVFVVLMFLTHTLSSEISSASDIRFIIGLFGFIVLISFLVGFSSLIYKWAKSKIERWING